ncbi:MAG: hypothetical protein AVDCRST_MAG48-2208, partial [uncultured Friedmanniella sp.]
RRGQPRARRRAGPGPPRRLAALQDRLGRRLHAFPPGGPGGVGRLRLLAAAAPGPRGRGRRRPVAGDGAVRRRRPAAERCRPPGGPDDGARPHRRGPRRGLRRRPL